MTIRIDKEGRQYEHTTVYVPIELHKEAKSLNIGFSKVLEDALLKKIDSIRSSNTNVILGE